jgi:peptidoglycan/LPS O-acetylase OafA/YrhL
VTGTAAEVATPAGGTGPRPGRRHLYQVDVVRLLTFACVVGVHTASLTSSPSSVGAGVVEVLLHFTRDAFFMLSAFVLFLANGRGHLRVGSFWRRRFLFIGVPYVVWTVVYWEWWAGVPSGVELRALGWDLLEGTGQYHLYFLVVSMQLYLLFPALLWLVRRTAGHHLALFVVAAVFEVAVMSLTHWSTWPGGWNDLQVHIYELAPTYAFYFVAGGLAAVHRDRFHAWVVGHPRGVLGLVAAAAVLQLGVYAAHIAVTGNPGLASDPLQPTMVTWSVAVVVGFYALGCRYADRRRPGSRTARLVDQASLVSFGVYLVHPLFLNTLLGRWLAFGPSPLPAALSGVLAWAGALLLSAVFAAVAVRTPLALPLTGRRRLAAGTGSGVSGGAA